MQTAKGRLAPDLAVPCSAWASEEGPGWEMNRKLQELALGALFFSFPIGESN